MNIRRMWFPSAVVVGAVAAVLACSAQKSGRGQLAVELVDAPNPAVDEIWVTVTQVRVHEAGSGWTTITPAQPLAVDLLKLQTYAAPLGLVDLPAGTVTQLRLVVEKDTSYVVTGGAQVALKVPSGAESGIKIHGPWKVSACTQTTVTLDFDGRRSIWYHQTTGGEEWILRPVIHTKKTAHAPVSCGEEGGGAEGGNAGGDGDACEGPTDCLSGVCSQEGSCEPGGPDVPCGEAADCASGTCNDDGTCAPGTAVGAGGSCSVSSDCLSNACDEATGACEPGLQGTRCGTDADCAEGYGCPAGECAAAAAQ